VAQLNVPNVGGEGEDGMVQSTLTHGENGPIATTDGIFVFFNATHIDRKHLRELRKGGFPPVIVECWLTWTDVFGGTQDLQFFLVEKDSRTEPAESGVMVRKGNLVVGTRPNGEPRQALS